MSSEPHNHATRRCGCCAPTVAVDRNIERDATQPSAGLIVMTGFLDRNAPEIEARCSATPVLVQAHLSP